MRYSSRCAPPLVVLALLGLCGTAVAAEGPAESSKPSQYAVRGPLRVFPANPRYFTDGSGKAVYLTGSHTWSNFQNWGIHKAVDFDAYLDFLQAHNHNFTRLWVTDTAWSPPYTDESGNKHDGEYSEPQPFVRTGPGDALDGKPKFDLTKLNPAYFDELRRRVAAAQRRGIYVAVMLFDTWGVSGYFPYSPNNKQWKGSPYNAANNVNGINGDPNGDGKGIEIHSLDMPAVTRVEEAYVCKVVDTLNDLDNLIYEVCNEGGTLEWNQHFADFIRDYEAMKPKQHPIGITAPADNEKLGAARADWIAAWGAEWKLHLKNPYEINPPAADGKKVIVADTDHIELPRDSEDPHVPAIWVWRSFTRRPEPHPHGQHGAVGDGHARWTGHQERPAGDGEYPSLCDADEPCRGDSARRDGFQRVLPGQSGQGIPGLSARGRRGQAGPLRGEREILGRVDASDHGEDHTWRGLGRRTMAIAQGALCGRCRSLLAGSVSSVVVPVRLAATRRSHQARQSLFQRFLAGNELQFDAHRPKRPAAKLID